MKKIGLLLLSGLLLSSMALATEPESKAGSIPEYGNWKNFTTKDGLPANKIYAVRADGDRVWIGTSNGLVLYENGAFRTFTTEDGLAHHGVLAIDVSELTGDVWIGTFGGMNRYSGGQFETFTQFNSGLANDVIYSVVCDGKDVWCATGGGAGHYDTYTEEWEIYTERNAPMHEPWTYSVCAGDNKVFIAAWGGGVIEYQKETGHFRDYVDPDGEMEIDLFPDDGVVHDITTAVTFANGILWVATYFGMSRYDGAHWKGYFDHDSGLASNFINFVRAVGDVVWLCTDNGLSSFNSEEWVTYKKTEQGGSRIYWKDGQISTKSDPTGMAHNFTIGVDFQGDEYIWVATSYGLSRGTRIN
jgi:ligand-binding sensor domain-containing protein